MSEESKRLISNFDNSWYIYIDIKFNMFIDNDQERNVVIHIGQYKTYSVYKFTPQILNKGMTK